MHGFALGWQPGRQQLGCYTLPFTIIHCLHFFSLLHQRLIDTDTVILELRI